MKHILDTHALLWFLKGEKLTKDTIDSIENGKSCISVISLWEVSIKMAIGKYSFDGGFIGFRNLVRNNGFPILPIKDEHLERLSVLPLIHRDPFDRLLIATALEENLSI
ncbi:MAG: type II toxin-antitoxin system VapC family toxin, partial [Clostridiales bacterium]|nr:type II toxin-antitoxin system VapC family toxin [Clostridiales bacterium]